MQPLYDISHFFLAADISNCIAAIKEKKCSAAAARAFSIEMKERRSIEREIDKRRSMEHEIAAEKKRAREELWRKKDEEQQKEIKKATERQRMEEARRIKQIKKSPVIALCSPSRKYRSGDCVDSPDVGRLVIRPGDVIRIKRCFADYFFEWGWKEVPDLIAEFGWTDADPSALNINHVAKTGIVPCHF